MRPSLLVLALAGCPKLPDSDTETDTQPDVDSDTDTTLACIDDAFEDNDDALTAAAVDLGVPLAGQICEADDDWYAIDVPGGCDVEVRLSFVDEDGDLDLELWNEDRRLGSGTSSTDDETALGYVDDDATLTVRVLGFAGAENRYTLAAHLTCAPCVLPDRYEDNDTAATAVPAAFPITADACAGDPDWYGLGTTGTCGMRVTAARVEGDLSDVAIAATDTSGTVLATAWEAAPGRVLNAILPIGAKLSVLGADATRLDLDVEPSCPLPAASCTTDDGWDNHEVPLLVPVGTSADALACPGATDLWRLAPSDGCTGTIAVAADGLVDVTVRRDGAVIDSAAATGSYAYASDRPAELVVSGEAPYVVSVTEDCGG